MLLADLFPELLHVRDAGLKSGSDPRVWEFAKAQGFTIISKDGDFRHMSLVFGHQVIGLMLGNCPTVRVEMVVRSSQERIRRFEVDPASSFLELP